MQEEPNNHENGVEGSARTTPRGTSGFENGTTDPHALGSDDASPDDVTLLPPPDLMTATGEAPSSVDGAPHSLTPARSVVSTRTSVLDPTASTRSLRFGGVTSSHVRMTAASEGAVRWLKERLHQLCPDPGTLRDNDLVSPDEWLARGMSDRHTQLIHEFLGGDIGTQRFFASVHGVQLTLAHAVPAEWDRLIYFVRRPTDEPLTAETAPQAVLYGMLTGGDVYEGLLRLMNSVFIPGIIANVSWPETVRKEFIGHVHKFMAHFTETAYQKQAKTVLYIPKVSSSSACAFCTT